MSTLELQNQLIRRILDISDQEFLEYLCNIAGNEKTSSYQLTPFEKQFLKESSEEYSTGKVRSNEKVFSKTDQWLSE
ncbi:MAG: hypothetical protein NTX43_11185 [Bacteroidetes bacterium]|nr:hypothetical protein [Bacteroidota bacterium]